MKLPGASIATMAAAACSCATNNAAALPAPIFIAAVAAPYSGGCVGRIIHSFNVVWDFGEDSQPAVVTLWKQKRSETNGLRTEICTATSIGNLSAKENMVLSRRFNAAEVCTEKELDSIRSGQFIMANKYIDGELHVLLSIKEIIKFSEARTNAAEATSDLSKRAYEAFASNYGLIGTLTKAGHAVALGAKAARSLMIEAVADESIDKVKSKVLKQSGAFDLPADYVKNLYDKKFTETYSQLALANECG